MGVERACWRDIELLLADLRGEWDERIVRIARSGHPTAMMTDSPSLHSGVLPGPGVFAPNADVQIFTPAVSGHTQLAGVAGRDGTWEWVKPPGVTHVAMFGVGAGGGGGSGRKGSTTTVCCGGGGGGSGNYGIGHLLAMDVPDKVPVIVGAGSAGGLGVSANDTNGNAGAIPNNTLFGSTTPTTGASGGALGPTAASLLWGVGAARGGGAGGTATSGSGGAGGDTSKLFGGWNGVGGANASTTGAAGSAGSTGPYSPGGGGSGGGLTSANAHSAGGGGGLCGHYWSVAGSSGGGNNGSASAWNGPPGANGLMAMALGMNATGFPVGAVLYVLPTDRYFQPGVGGGGGASSASADAISGGWGGNGFWGAGGGGGGAATDTTCPQSGAGGNGGDGYLIVLSW